MALRHRFWRLGCNLELFLVGSESNVRHRQPQARAWSVPQWHCVSVWRSQRFEAWRLQVGASFLSFQYLVVSKSNVRHRQPQAGPIDTAHKRRVAQGSAARDVLLLSGRRPRSPCPCRRPSVATESYLSAYARQPARGPMLRWYGSSWEQDLKAMLPHREAMQKTL